MKLPKGIAYGPIITWSVVLALASAACGWILARRLYPFMLLDLPVMALAIARILHHYGDSVRRVTFMFNAIDSDEPVDDFNVRNLGFQVRYRYEVAPLSYLYVVYGRGGFRQDAFSDSTGSLLRDSFSLRDDEQLLVKFSYRFEL